MSKRRGARHARSPHWTGRAPDTHTVEKFIFVQPPIIEPTIIEARNELDMIRRRLKNPNLSVSTRLYLESKLKALMSRESGIFFFPEEEERA